MKKNLALLLCAGLSLTLFACGGNNSKSSSAANTTSVENNIIMQNINKNSNFHFFINFIKSSFTYFLIASKNSSKLSEIAQKKNNS